jgi:hypothetical protein
MAFTPGLPHVSRALARGSGKLDSYKFVIADRLFESLSRDELALISDFFSCDVDSRQIERRTDRRNKKMQYLLLIYEDEKRFSQGYEPGEMAEYRAFGQEFAEAVKGGKALKPTNTAATVRVRNGKAQHFDGPFAETKEQLGGFYLVEAKSRDEALAMAAKIPGARFGCVEVRPIETFE